MSRFTHFDRHKILAARHFQLFCTPVDRLACLPQFEGHNNISLRDRYHGMILNARSKLEKSISRREVTVNQVEKWWNTSTRRPKRVDQLEKEESILEAYYAVQQEIRIGVRKL